jgi:hypothetical protein
MSALCASSRSNSPSLPTEKRLFGSNGLLKLPPGDLKKFVHGNADRLLKLKNGVAKK